MMWVKKDMTEPVNDCHIFGWGALDMPKSGFGAVLHGGDVQATVGGQDYRSSFASSSLDDGLWHHLVIENANGKIIQYLDGVAVGDYLLGSLTTTFSPSDPQQASGVFLGGTGNGNSKFKGYVAEIGVHKRQVFDLVERGRLTDIINARLWGGGLSDGNLGDLLGHELVAYYNFKDGHLDEKVNGGNELILRSGTIDLVSTDLRNL